MIQVALLSIGAAVVALAAFVWRSRPDNPTNRWFAAFTLAVGGWTLGVAGLYGGTYLEVWARFTFASASLIPATFLAFVLVYPSECARPLLSRLTLFVSYGFSVVSLSTPLIVYDPEMTLDGLFRKAGPLYLPFAVYFIVTAGWAIWVCVSKWKSARGQDRVQLQYLGAAVLISVTGGTITNLVTPLVTGKSIYSWVGPYFGLVLVVLTAHAIIRHRLMDLRLVVHRGLTLAIAMVVSLVPVAALLVLAWPRLSLHLEPDELLALLVAVVAVALLIPVTRDLAGRLLDRYVYRTHVNYRRTLREASEALTRVLDLRRLLPFLNHTVAASTNAEGAAVYLAGGAGFSRAIAETRDAPGGFTAPEEAPAAVMQALQASRDLLLTDEVVRERPTPERQRLHAALSEAGWALVLPLLSESQVIGAIAVGPKLSGDPFYPQDLDLLMTLANQAGIAVKNAQLYAQVVLANEHLNNIVTTIESGVVAVDAGGEITLFNRAAERLTGIPAAQARTRPVAALPACLGQALRDTLAEGAARTQPEVELSDGTVTRPIICTTSPLHDPEGRLLGAVAVFSDLTPLKELEVERRRAERLAYFEMLAAGIAHEIKNPLVAIKTFAQLLPRKQGDPKFSEDFGRIVTREIGRMERLLERLRTMARPGERPVRALDLRAPLGDALEATRPAFNEKSIVVSTATGPRPCFVLGDHAELEQLFLNLLMNAHEATPPRGMVRVELAVGAARATVAVVDTGPGIPSEFLDRVFDPFFTTKQRGSGLGLAICASIAQRHGARLRAGNRPAGGAVFTLEFPLAVTPAPVSA